MPTDLNQRAKAIVDLATSEEELPDRTKAKTLPRSRSAARAVRRAGRHGLRSHARGTIRVGSSRLTKRYGKPPAPAMAAGLARAPWSVFQIAELID